MRYIWSIMWLALVVVTTPTLQQQQQRRLTARLNVNHNIGLDMSGTYSNSMSLSSRLLFQSKEAQAIPPHQYVKTMSSRHLWNYFSILILSIGTLNSSHHSVVQFKSQMGVIMQRLQNLHVAEQQHDDDVDIQCLQKIHEDIAKYLLPPADLVNSALTSIQLNLFLQYRKTSHLCMYKALFDFWKTPNCIIQLIARSLMPSIYLLHTVHDPQFVHQSQLLSRFYEPLHQCVALLQDFLTIGTKKQYEIALTHVDVVTFPLT